MIIWKIKKDGKFSSGGWPKWNGVGKTWYRYPSQHLKQLNERVASIRSRNPNIAHPYEGATIVKYELMEISEENL
jgi:hypothetical protein